MPEPLESHVDLASLSQEERLARMRHSAAHVLAEAMLDLMPDAELGIGPPIDTGFYYDFRLPRALTQEDLAWLEERMRQSISKHHQFQMAKITRQKQRRAGLNSRSSSTCSKTSTRTASRSVRTLRLPTCAVAGTSMTRARSRRSSS